jgi:MYXO-CTERM domain-containing protein
MRPLLAALLLLPAAGFAQSGIVLTLNGAGTSGVVARNATGCSTILAGTWTGTGLTGACSPLQVWLTTSTSSCGAAPSTTNVPADVVVYTIPAGSLTTGALTQASFNFNFTALPGFAISGNGPCGQVVDFTNQLCAGVTLNDTTGACQGTAVTSTPILSVRYDNVPPDPPLLSITQLDSQLAVRLSPSDPSDTIATYNVQYAVEPSDGGTPNYASAGSAAANNAVVTISGLTNGTNYLVYGTSIDEAGNPSAPSTPVVSSPVVTLGFYTNYINAGGQPGGCGHAAGSGPSVLALAAVMLLGLVRRRG